MRCSKLASVCGVVFFVVNHGAANPAPGWDYQYQVHLAGTRSESITGTLLFKGRELPVEFDQVITPIGEFIFTSVHGSSGAEIRWSPVIIKDGKVLLKSTDMDVKNVLSGTEPGFRKCSTELQYGSGTSTKPFIAGSFEERPKEAGRDWFYAVKRQIWVNPEKMDEVAKLKFSSP